MRPPRQLVLLGHPVAHSLSPLFQQAALDACGIAMRYDTRDVAPDALPAALDALRAAGAAGNVTLPHKTDVLARCDEVTPLARRVGAVNTFWVDDAGRLCGDNTDVGGFEAAVRAVCPRDLAGLRVLVLGAGGAALAVREAVASWPGATLAAWARNAEQSQRLVAALGARGHAVPADVEALAAAARSADLIVNATPVGLASHEGMPMPVAAIPDGVAVLDLTYRRGEPTPWVAACRARGLTADDGLRMLVEQGALAFERWFARPAPRDVMLRAVGRSA